MEKRISKGHPGSPGKVSSPTYRSASILAFQPISFAKLLDRSNQNLRIFGFGTTGKSYPTASRGNA